MGKLLKRTTKGDQRIARESISQVKNTSQRLKSSKNQTIKIQIQESDEIITIPKKAFSLLLSILSNMAEGKSVTIIPSDSEISTQQAAELLNVSRPHLVKLLESGSIPFKKVGSHRRILLNDLMEYDKNLSKNREKQLQFLSEQAQNLDLGYE